MFTVREIARIIANNIKSKNPNDFKSSLKWEIAVDIAWGDYDSFDIKPTIEGVESFINSRINN